MFVRPPPSLTWCLCVVLLGAVPHTSCPICCSCRVYIYIYLRADCAQARGDFTRQSDGVAVVVWRAYRGMPDSFRWLEGAEEHRRVWSAGLLVCGLLGNCVWIGCFSQPQCHSHYSSPFPSPLGHVFPPSSRTSLMRKLPTVAGGARHRRRRCPPSRSFI